MIFNKIIDRERERAEILTYLTQKNSIILSGPDGIGKKHLTTFFIEPELAARGMMAESFDENPSPGQLFSAFNTRVSERNNQKFKMLLREKLNTEMLSDTFGQFVKEEYYNKGVPAFYIIVKNFVYDDQKTMRLLNMLSGKIKFIFCSNFSVPPERIRENRCLSDARGVSLTEFEPKDMHILAVELIDYYGINSLKAGQKAEHLFHKINQLPPKPGKVAAMISQIYKDMVDGSLRDITYAMIDNSFNAHKDIDVSDGLWFLLLTVAFCIITYTQVSLRLQWWVVQIITPISILLFIAIRYVMYEKVSSKRGK